MCVLLPVLSKYHNRHCLLAFLHCQSSLAPVLNIQLALRGGCGGCDARGRCVDHDDDS